VARRFSLSGSNLAFVGMVIGAGAIAWYGTMSRPGEPTTPAEAATIAPAVAANELPEVRELPRGSLPTRLVVPSAGIDTSVVEVGVVVDRGKATWETAWRAAGHHIDSARPGQPGNVVITGHVSVADRANLAVFKTLNQVHPGDIIEMQTGDQVYRYAVTKVSTVDPNATNVLRSSHQSTVTLITCTPDLKQRLVVTGTLV